jgi:hypothetical protein
LRVVVSTIGETSSSPFIEGSVLLLAGLETLGANEIKAIEGARLLGGNA